MLGANGLESSFVEEALGMPVDSNLTRASNVLLWQRLLMVSWAAPEGAVAAG